MRKQYILLKDTPELLKGAILEEKCDDGTQDFQVINRDYDAPHQEGGGRVVFHRKVVTHSPEWFEEVSVLRVTKAQLVKITKLLGDTVLGKKKAKKK